MYYIQRTDSHRTETVDEFETKQEAVQMAQEYQLSDPSASYRISTRPSRDWE